MNSKVINLKDTVNGIKSRWTPQHILTLNNSHSFKIATIKGDFIWHSHPNTDEFFYCVSGGPFRIELNTKATSPKEAERLGGDDIVELKVGDCFYVPRGMQHRPVSDVDSGILIVEAVGTVNTGDREGDDHGRTVYVDESEK